MLSLCTAPAAHRLGAVAEAELKEIAPSFQQSRRGAGAAGYLA